jgi:hypothetical protein
LIKTTSSSRHNNNPSADDDSLSSYDKWLKSFYEDMGWQPLFYNRDDHSTSSTTSTARTFYKLLKQCTKALDGAEKLVNKINTSQTLATNRKSIPQNATIRSEYIKCGKDRCSHETHGPYYYAYWKDAKTKKLMKKYIGDRMPNNKEANDDCNNDY